MVYLVLTGISQGANTTRSSSASQPGFIQVLVGLPTAAFHFEGLPSRVVSYVPSIARYLMFAMYEGVRGNRSSFIGQM